MGTPLGGWRIHKGRSVSRGGGGDLTVPALITDATSATPGISFIENELFTVLALTVRSSGAAPTQRWVRA